MRVFIIRHGDREKDEYYNIYLRHKDPPLNEEGKRKAKKLVDYFENIQIDRIMVSEYLRTSQTAQYIAEYKDIQISRDRRLNEIDNGIIESMSDEEIEEKFPEFWSDFISHSKDIRFPEGETGEEVRSRQKDLLDELALNQESVLLVSHEGYIRLLMCHLLNLPIYKRYLFKVDFCGIMEFELIHETKEWRIIRFNQSGVDQW